MNGQIDSKSEKILLETEDAMDSAELKKRISNLTIWKNGDQRAPHKPLLILYALGQLQNQKPRLLSYSQVRDPLKELLIEFGPHRRSYHPEQPFARLINDGIWDLNVVLERSDIHDSCLMKNDVKGGFREEVYSILKDNDNLVQEIAQIILKEHFPETIHNDILEAVGPEMNLRINKPRDPYFRERILRAYEHKCAVCGFNVRLGNNLIAVEAAHIKWH